MTIATSLNEQTCHFYYQKSFYVITKIKFKKKFIEYAMLKALHIYLAYALYA